MLSPSFWHLFGFPIPNDYDCCYTNFSDLNTKYTQNTTTTIERTNETWQQKELQNMCANGNRIASRKLKKGDGINNKNTHKRQWKKHWHSDMEKESERKKKQICLRCNTISNRIDSAKGKSLND